MDVDSANIVAGVCDSKGKSMMECFVKTDSIFRAGKAVETAALWKLWKNHSKEGDHPLVIFPPVPTASAAGFLSPGRTSEQTPFTPACAMRRHTPMRRPTGFPETGAGCQGNIPAAAQGVVCPSLTAPFRGLHLFAMLSSSPEGSLLHRGCELDRGALTSKDYDGTGKGRRHYHAAL